MDTEIIQSRILIFRSTRVILDYHLAELYQVPTKALKQAVRRNRERFPPDFMFELSQAEYSSLWSQTVTLKNSDASRGKHSKYSAFAFTEQGVAMLSSILRSKIAIQTNIAIMRAFVLLRQNLENYETLRMMISKLEEDTNMKFEAIHNVLNYLLGPQGERTVVKGYRK
jgi:hypothetical protein